MSSSSRDLARRVVCLSIGIAVGILSAACDLATTISASNDTVNVAQPFSVTVTAQDDSYGWGWIESGSVCVDVVLPANLSLVAVSSPLGECTGTSTVTCDLGVFMPGYHNHSINLDVVGTVPGPASITSKIRDCSSQVIPPYGTSYGDPTGDNNVATANVTVATRCGDGVVDPEESCDSGAANGAPGACCSSTCAAVLNGEPCNSDGNVCTDDLCDGNGSCIHASNSAPCDDGLFCNGLDTCASGECGIHAGDPCAGGAQCADTCSESARSCNTAAGTVCSDDGLICSTDVCDGLGVCAHSAGNVGVICRPASDLCDLAEACDGVGIGCPVDQHRPDADGDGICDAVDICTNVGAGRTFRTDMKSKLSFANVGSDVVPGNDKLVAQGTFALPPGQAFGALSPLLRGARLVVEGPNSERVVDVALPAGPYAGKGTRGWKSNGRQSAWQYVDKTSAPIAGVASVKIVDRGNGLAGGLVSVSATGKAGTYSVRGADLPLKLIVVLGDQSDAAAGICGESAFQANNCAVSGSGRAVQCKR